MAAEQKAQLALFETEARLTAAPAEDKPEWTQRVQDARRTLSERTASVFAELRGLVPAVDPLTSEQMLAALSPGEVLVTWAWADDGVVALVAQAGDGGGAVTGVTLASNRDETAKLNEALSSLRTWIAARPRRGDRSMEPVLAAARDAAVPPALRGLMEGASSVIAVVDGPLAGIPIELLITDVPVSYAPTATIALRPRLDGTADPLRVAAASGRTSSASAQSGVIVGDPIFAGYEREEPDYPDAGILIAMVTDGSNAEIAGVLRGDVLLAYGDHELASPADLGPAIGATAQTMATRSGGAASPSEDDRPVTARVWRLGDDGQGQEIEVSLALGRMGVQLSQATPADGLRSMAVLNRSADAIAANATAMEQYRFYGGGLSPLPATRIEAEAIASMLGDGSTVLIGQDATAPRLREAMESSPPRVLHLATHGLLGSSNRPLLASIALTTPDEPTGEDNGFVTLGDILSTWGGQLRDTELVVLSACDTGMGVQQGDTMMALPLGLLISGADTVVASLWSVDDLATALLMARFYANWLGRAETEREIDGVRYSAGEAMPKLASLREAQAWLRSLSHADRDRLIGVGAEVVTAEVSRSTIKPRPGQLTTPSEPAATPRDPGGTPIAPGELTGPYAHPYYWAGFVLYGADQ